MKTVQKKLGYFELSDDENLHEALEAAYGSGFAQWLVDRFPEIFTEQIKASVSND